MTLVRLFRKPTLVGLFLVTVLAGALVACGSDEAPAAGATSTNAPASGTGVTPEKPVTLRLGYFPNITHAQPIVGLAQGTFVQELGPNVKLETKTFNAGPSVIEALFAGAIDAAYIGPNPAITGYVQSGGKDVRIIAGATSAGVLLIVKADSGITKPADFANKRIATPQLGNTQDIAARAWLQKNGLKDKDHGGNVDVRPIANADALALFIKGELQAAWAPEPWATRLIVEGNGKVFLDERDLWPNGDFVTTHLIVSAKFLAGHPETVEKLLRAHVKTTQWISENPDQAKKVVNDGIKQITSAALPEAVINGAWRNQKSTYDPIASSLRKSADDAFALGYLGEKKPDLAGIYALDTLNKVLNELGLKEVSK